MEVSEVLNEIKQKQTRCFYVFSGTELEVQWLYIRNIAKANNQEIRYVDDFQSIYGKLKNNSFMNKSYCYVVRDDKDIMTNEKLWVQLGTNDLPFNILGNNTLICLISDLDKRTKFYKQYKTQIVEFETLPEPLLIKYIKKEIDLSNSNCRRLIEICESNYGRILLEIDKVEQYRKALDLTRDDEMSDDYFFEQLLKDGTIYQPPKDAVFDFVDAVLRRQPKRAFQLLQESYTCGEATMVLIQVLYNNTKQMLQVQSCESKDVGKSTGLSAWQVKCARDRIGKWKIGELVNLLKDIRNAEIGIKTGVIEEDFAMNYILTKNL